MRYQAEVRRVGDETALPSSATARKEGDYCTRASRRLCRVADYVGRASQHRFLDGWVGMEE